MLMGLMRPFELGMLLAGVATAALAQEPRQDRFGSAEQSVMSSSTTAAAQARYDRAVAAMMENMSDPSRSFELAEAATQSGNVRGAIAALEGLLLLDPSLSNIKLELGLLYLRAGSPVIAERFIKEALEDPAAPPEVRARATQYALAAEEQQKTWRVSADLYTGLRYETNANAATRSSSVGIVLGGLPVVGILEPNARGQADVSAVVSARAQISYDLGLQSGSSILSNISYYGSKYFEQSENNLDILTADVGPVVFLGNTPGSGWSARPYVTAALVLRGEEFYQSGTGVGLSLNGPLAGGLGFTSDTTASYLDYNESSDYPTLDRKDGWSLETSPGLTYAVSPTVFLQGNVVLGRMEADSDSETYWQTGVRASVSKAFQNPFGLDVPLWVATVSAGYRNLDYDRPDTVFSLTEAQEDDRSDIGLSIQAPLTNRWAVVGDVRYLDSSSNYDIYDYDNFSTSLGVAVKF